MMKSRKVGADVGDLVSIGRRACIVIGVTWQAISPNLFKPFELTVITPSGAVKCVNATTTTEFIGFLVDVDAQ